MKEEVPFGTSFLLLRRIYIFYAGIFETMANIL